MIARTRVSYVFLFYLFIFTLETCVRAICTRVSRVLIDLLIIFTLEMCVW